ncbi:MAG TPA: EAL domain-containing protein [Burkholderiaceae bacterium]|nr:EAL domain-containing protein [Burkholderiaceae bacterium]
MGKADLQPPGLSHDAALQRLVRLAALSCGASMAVLVEIDDTQAAQANAARTRIGAAFGLAPGEAEAALTLDGECLSGTLPCTVMDAREDPRLALSPLVAGPLGVRLYASAPLLAADGQPLGALAVMDPLPRLLDSAQREILDTLAAQAASQLELRRLRLTLEQATTESERMQATLRQQSETLQIAGEIARVGGWIVELPSQRLLWSTEVAAIFERPEAVSLSLDEAFLFYAPEWRGHVARVFAACVREGTPFDEEVEITTGTGRRVWVRALGQAVRDALGLVTRVQGAFQDISERKRGEAALRESEQRFKHVARATADAIWDWDLVLGSVWWNEGMQSLFGVIPDTQARTASAWSTRLHADDKARVVRGLHAAIDGPGDTWSDEYRFLRGDGRYAYVLDRGFVIRAADGKPLRMVGGMTDLTASKRAEEGALRDAEARAGIVRIQQEIAALDLDLPSVMTIMAERARDLTHATGGLIELVEGDEIVCRAASGETARQIGTRLRIEGSLSGIAIASDQVLLCDDAQTDSRVDRALALAVRARSVIAAPLRAGPQVIGVLKVLSNQPHAFTLRDVTNLQILVESLGATIQRQRIAAQLQASEAQYRMMFDNNPQPMWVFETTGLRFLAVNRTTEEHYGYSEAEFLSMTVRSVWVAEEVSQVEEHLRTLDVADRMFGVKRKHRRKDGSVIDVVIAADAIVFNGQPARLVLINDVTERLRAERDLARVSRAQAMLSACNEALIRADDEPALLQEICRITVEIGGYRMAHVGYAQMDETKSLQSVANAGDGSAYLQSVQLSWDESQPGGKGPSGRVIRSGRPVIIEDLAQEPAFQPWIDRATAHGFRGLVSLPLCDRGSTFGVLALLASEVAHITGHEVKLLEELANDLAFGICNLRAQQERQRLQEAVLKVATAVSARTGTDFFVQLVRNMAETLGAQCGMISRLVANPSPTAQTIAVVSDGEERSNFEYALEGTPGANLLAADSYVVPERVAEQFPRAALLSKLGVQACVGRRLDSSSGQPLGVLSVLFREPLKQPEFVISTLQIFAARAAAELERQEADARIRDQASLLDKAQDAILVRSIDHRILYWNKSAERLYGWASDEVLGHSVLPLLYRDLSAFLAACATTVKHGEWNGEIVQHCRDGRELVVEGRWTLVRNEHGEPQSILAINTDISQRKANELQIQKLAFFDPLTTLPNRMLLMDRLQHALMASARSGRGGALLFIDLDNFKTLNDTLGHDKGDLLLQQVAQRLTACVREADTVARLGGDEFVVMLEELSESEREVAVQARVVGEKILAALSMPYVLAGYEHQSTSSIGVAPFSEQHQSVGELLKQADLAMYQSKSAGRNTLRFFDPGMQAVVSARAALEVDLRQALAQDEFLLYYQPQFNEPGRVTGVEALVRWKHPQRGMVSPAEFIPLAEETGLIMPLGRWVLETACTLLATWHARAATAALTLAVNVSPRQFRHPDFVDQVVSVLHSTGANPLNLKLELTESLLVDDMEVTIAKMSALKALGVGFALDDFGTGYSSLSYLKRLPLDQLKIDQSFVHDVLSDPNDAVIARTIIALGQSLGLDVIAEGVETEAQRAFLARHGCNAYQGYLFSRPMPESALLAYLQETQGSLA